MSYLENRLKLICARIAIPSQLKYIERKKITLQYCSTDTNIHSLAAIFKVNWKIIEILVNKFELEGTEQWREKTGTWGYNWKRDRHFKLELRRSIRENSTQSIRCLARERRASVMKLKVWNTLNFFNILKQQWRETATRSIYGRQVCIPAGWSSLSYKCSRLKISLGWVWEQV